jgi:lipooligosaccharide transport system permease protein
MMKAAAPDWTAVARLNRRARLRRSWLIVWRNILVFRTARLALLSGLIEPLVYLLTLGVLVDRLVGAVPVAGRPVRYLVFVAPGLLAATMMNLAVNESVSNLYYKLKLSRAYDAVLVTPVSGLDLVLGELGWTLLRSVLYAVPFIAVLIVLGVATVAAAPLMMLIVLLEVAAFSAVGIVAATYLHSWQQRDLVQAALLPMFYLCGTVFPVDRYPPVARWVVEATPLYQVVDLLRVCCFEGTRGDWSVAVGYLGALVIAGGALAARRIEILFRV